MTKARGKQATAGGDAHAAALAYAARGWSVIPIEPRGKRPLLPWLEFQQRLAAADEIEGWFRHWPDANVGLVTGRVSGLVVVDVDPRHGGQASLERLRDEHGPLPRTVEAETGGGGRHLYFSYPGALVHNRVGILPGIDLRADGGCVVAPPSRHPSGRRYRWAEGSSPYDLPLANRVGILPGIDLRADGGCVVAPPSVHAGGRRYLWAPGRAPDDLPPAATPRWLLPAAPDGVQRGHPLAHWRELVRGDVAEGRRNNTLASLAGHLLWHGVDPPVVLELLHAFNRVRCRPPLPDDEVAQVVASITRLHERGRDE